MTSRFAPLMPSRTAIAVMAGLAACQLFAAPAKLDPLHAWSAGDDPVQLEAWVKQHLDAAQGYVDRIAAVKGKHTIANTLRPFDDAQNELALAGSQATVMNMVSKSAAIRDKAQALAETISGANAALSLNQAVYKALADIDLSKVDAASRQYLERSLLQYRLAGVDKDEATRSKVKQLQEKSANLQAKFSRNVTEDVRSFKVKPADLAGLPADFISRHKPDAEGNVTLTTDAPDMGPVMNFAKSDAVRHQMFLTYNQRAWPANVEVLRDLLRVRKDIANTLGFKSWADFATADQMVDSPRKVEALLAGVESVTRETGLREHSQLMAFAQSQQPDLKTMYTADRGYWAEQYRRATFNFDAQSVRPYFAYDTVQAGILKTAAHLFHVRFEQVKGLKLWDESVDAFDVFDGKRKIGRIYLDMHPRAGKDKWFTADPLVPGMKGRQLPEAMLICNFSGGVKGDPGLMEYGEVVTYFHEFGHLMHHLLGSQGVWSGQGGFNVEGDFVEAPSQMLEEFFSDYATLSSFAKHVETGEKLPQDLFNRMIKASAYGRATWLQRQMVFADMALKLHTTDPDTIDFDAVQNASAQRYLPTSVMEGDHFFAAFTHLTGYASNYYTYVLDKVIAIDFFSQFDRQNLLNGPATMKYRKAVLDPGASKPAAQLVKDFLGRPESMDATRNWINVQFK
ncbi:Zn-dependent oligopeptidase [Burkholderiaceae bacterium DAT-1]|nr:Zn-dependent oligopeptidase [Burkholderiaceae bacterium DAT-1]